MITREHIEWMLIGVIVLLEMQALVIVFVVVRDRNSLARAAAARFEGTQKKTDYLARSEDERKQHEQEQPEVDGVLGSHLF